FLDTLDEVALQLVFVRQPLPTNHFLRQRALLPPFLRRLISADVNVLAREDGHHLGENILQECKRPLLWTVNILVYSPLGANLERAIRAGQFWIRGNCGQSMPGKLDLGDHGDKALPGVLDDLARLLLRIVAAVWLSIESRIPPFPADTGLLPARPD